MKIALILFFQRKDTSDFIPWHFSYFKDILVHEGHDVDIIDNQIKEYSINELVDIVVRNKYELVGTGGIGTVYNDLKSFSTLLRQKNRSVLIVVGGQIVADYEFILKKIPIDVIVYGEGEKTLPKIVTAHIGNQSFSTVPGVAFRESGHVIKTPPEEPIDLNELPVLNFDNLEIEHYDTKVKDIFLINDHARELKERGERFLTVFLGRGCPYNCFFCYRQLKGYRTFNPDTIDAMFKLIKQKGFGFVQIIDECLTSNKNALRAVCASAKKYDIFWRANARADNMSPEIMRFLSEHNCEGVKIGIESFDPDMLNAMNKKTTPEMNIAAVNRAYQYGVHTGLQLILGTPGENRKTIFNTREGMWQCYFPQEKIACAILNPYPGSDAYFYGLERGYIRDKEYVHEHFEAKSKLVVNFSHISDRELVLWQQWLHCEAAISYRIKQRALLLSKHLTSIFLSFFKRAALLLVHEPVSFLCVVWYLLSGFRYWLKPVKRVVRCKEDNEKSGQLPFLNFW